MINKRYFNYVWVLSICILLIALLYFAIQFLSTASPLAVNELNSNNSLTYSPAAEPERSDINYAFVVGRLSSEQAIQITNAKVCAIGVANLNRSERYCVRVDGDGNFELSIPPSDYQLLASAEGFRSQDKPISLVANELRTENFKLKRATASVAGIVRGAGGEVIADATVSVFQNDKQVATLLTDSEGRFSGWAPGGMLQLQTYAPAYSLNYLQVVAPTLDIEISLFPGYTITGRVLQKYNLEPVAGIQVIASKNGVMGLYNHFSPSTRTNEKGEFNLTSLSLGQYTLAVQDLLWTTTSYPTTTVDIQHQAQSVDILVEEGAAVSGELRIQNSNRFCVHGQVALIETAIVGQVIPLFGGSTPPIHSAHVEEQGFFQFPALPAGEYQIMPECFEHQLVADPGQLVLSPGTTQHINFEFAQGLSLHVKIVDNADNPVAGASLVLIPSPNDVSDEILPRSVAVDENGSYTFGGLMPGTYQIQTALPGTQGESMVNESVHIYPTEAVQSHTLRLESGNYIKILSRQNEQGSSRVLFHATDSNGKRYEANVLGDGQFLLGPLPAEQYQVFAYDNKNPKKLTSYQGNPWITMRGNDTVALTFDYDKPEALLRGQVIDSFGNGVPMAAIRVVSDTLSDEDAFYSSTQEQMLGDLSVLTDANGNFSVSSLEPLANYNLYLAAPSGLEIQFSKVSPQNPLTIRLPRESSLSGELLKPDGETAPTQVAIDIVDVQGQQPIISKYIRTDGGKFNIDSLAPGEKEITVFDIATKSETKKTVVLKPGENTFVFSW